MRRGVHPGSRGAYMLNACPRCGTEKTESVRHGLIYKIFWEAGYHLRRCSYCNHWRLLRRGDRSRPHPNDMTMEQLQESFNRKIAASMAQPAPASPAYGGHMAMISDGELTGQPSPSSHASAAVMAEDADDGENYGSCPKCGSRRYHRSHRRWHERLMQRPRMARCSKCGHRFVYPQ